MTKKTYTSREFNQNTAAAKRAAKRGPVYITDRNIVAYVLTTVDDYERRHRKVLNLAESLAMPGGEEIEFEPPRMGPIARDVEFD